MHAPSYTPEQVLLYVETIDNHAPYAGMKKIILEAWTELKALFDAGQIDQRDFVEQQSILWQKYEDAGDAEVAAEKVRGL